MKKLLLLLLILILIGLQFLSAEGIHETNYNHFISIIRYDYPLTKLANINGLDINTIDLENRGKVSKIKSDEEFLFLLRSIANKYMAFDYIDVSLNQNKGNVSTNISIDSNFKPSYYYLPSHKTMVFTISSLRENELNGGNFIIEALSSCDDIENIIFDLSGCKRGEKDDGIDSIMSHFGGYWSYSYTAYFRNEKMAETVFEKESIKSVEDKRIHDELGLEFCVPVTYEKNYGESKLNENIVKAKRWILVDDSTSYAADFLASFASQSGWATVVGTPTYGNGTGYSTTTWELGSILVTINPCTIDNARGGLKAETGTIPNITSKKGVSAMKTCLELIENNYNYWRNK